MESNMRGRNIIIGLGGVTLLALGVSGTTIARPLTPAQEAAVQPAGKPVNCLHLEQIDETRVRDDQTIDFIMHGGKVYRNRLPNSCPSLGFEERFSYSPGIQELCSADIITVLQQGPGLMPGASCGLGQFVPVTGANG
jgi:hypothetical protein